MVFRFSVLVIGWSVLLFIEIGKKIVFGEDSLIFWGKILEILMLRVVIGSLM